MRPEQGGNNESLQKEINIRGGAVAQEVTVPLFGTAELTLEVEKKVDGGSSGISTNVYIFDATVKPIQK